MNQNPSVRKLVRCGVVAAIYVVLCMALQPLSYGAVQVRVAEALCLLPVFGAEYIAGVVLGCFLANLLGSTIVDVIFGTLATLLACLVTYKLRNIRIKGLAVAASLPPVLFNAVIIGIEIAVMFRTPLQRSHLAGLHHQRHLRRYRRAHQLHRSGCATGEDHREQQGTAQNFCSLMTARRFPCRQTE